ncbi:MAG TPA: hypothetical protein VGQ12_00490 [Candidatus Angelobacter sp.]|nr:hypothetical protein [Candidatus Angelobacter sp.]
MKAAEPFRLGNVLSVPGFLYIFETRSTAAVGQKYDEAYRYAASRKKSGGVGQNMVRLEAAEGMRDGS